MITGFESQTSELSREEIEISKVIIRGLERRIGKENAVSSNEMMKGLARMGIDIAGSRVRKIINYIRNTNAIPGLAANSNGYYCVKNIEELDEYIKSLQERIDAQLYVLESLKKQRNSYATSIGDNPSSIESC